MIRRKLDENLNNKIKRIAESFHKTNSISNETLNELYETIFEDVNTVNTIFIHPQFDEEYDWWYGNELFEEVHFKSGEVHYFLTEELENKMHITEIKLPKNMLSHKEYF